MKKVLIIGSTVVDVIIHINRLPQTAEDVHVQEQHMSLGGCAYNVSDTVRHFQVPYTLFSPVGTGAYGQFVKEALAAKGIETPIPTPSKDNGCCYCFIEENGERTFLSYHGAEYLFQPEWFGLIHAEEYAAAYLCGLELEEETGGYILDFLEQTPHLTVYFAPGPRICKIDAKKMKRILALHPILHLNKTEALSYTSCTTVEDAAKELFAQFSNSIIITLGSQGAYYETGKTSGYVSPVPAKQLDTIGAGDAHVGAVMACRMLGDSLEHAISKANCVSSAVIQTSGALLPDSTFEGLDLVQPINGIQ